MRRVKAGPGFIDVCSKEGCDGPLRTVFSTVAGPSESLLGDLRRPFTLAGLAVAVALAMPELLTSLPMVGGAFRVVYLAALSGYYFRIVEHVGRGREGLPGPSDAFEDAWTLIRDVARGVVCALVALAPIIVWLVLDRRAGEMLERGSLAPLALVFIGLALAPAAILGVVLTRSTIGAVWPVTWIRIVSRAPISYLRLVALFLAAGVVWATVGRLASLLFGRIPFLGEALEATALNLVVFLQAALVGGFVRRNADELGYE
ncbi:MAG: hypothetical protein HYY06_01670 [Deltaproteobacteria bacterium]|nr:hypothetical protein [Deltaproteobacteria bacterium]